MTWSNLRQLPFAVLLALAVFSMGGMQLMLENLWFKPLATEVTALRQGLPQPQQNAVKPTPPLPAVLQRLDEVLTRLTVQPDAQTRISQLHQLASQHAVALRKVSYLYPKPAGQVTRLEIVANVSGSYPDIRLFLRDALAQDEALALDSLQLSRATGGAGVRAQIKLTLFSRSSAQP